MHRAAAGLGAFGISIVDLEPEADRYPEHDHSEDGIGGRMFVRPDRPRAHRPRRPSVVRKITPGPDGGTL
jgi:hypothetical protein